MSERQDLWEMLRSIGRHWWLPLVMSALGCLVGYSTAMNIAPVHRSEATLLVGPTDGAVTQSATIRTSENLAIFYADMARRQLVLEPVVDDLGLDSTWSELRNQVSAGVPQQNLRLVTVTVTGEDAAVTDAVADAVVDELVGLSPDVDQTTEQVFVNEQVAKLRSAIEDGQRDSTALEQRISQASDQAQRVLLNDRLAELQSRISEWQGTYVDLIAVEPTSGAGGLSVLDEATEVAGVGRSGPVRQSVIGAVLGGLFGIVLAWLLQRRATRRARPVEDTGVNSRSFEATSGADSTTATPNGKANGRPRDPVSRP